VWTRVRDVGGEGVMHMGFAEILERYGANYAKAVFETMSMTFVCFCFAMAIAILITVLRVSPIKPLRIVGDLYVQIFRNIPGVALLVVVAYALPNLKVVLQWKTCVEVTVVLLASAFGSENFMTGINAIGVGQIEAARSIGLTFGQTMRKIVIPQALRSAVLPMTNLLIATMLSTSLGSQVPLNPQELTGLVSYITTRSTGAGIVPFVISALCYAGTAVLMGVLGNLIDKKVRVIR
jgi:glutamate transport system permease protein